MRFTRAVGRVKNREGKRICLNLPDGAKFLDSREIYYVEIQNRMLHYHTKAGVFTIRGALKDVQEELEDWHFAKCNQCYLVNLKYVSEIRKNIAVVSGDELEISRRNRPAFLSAVVGSSMCFNSVRSILFDRKSYRLELLGAGAPFIYHVF